MRPGSTVARAEIDHLVGGHAGGRPDAFDPVAADQHAAVANRRAAEAVDDPRRPHQHRRGRRACGLARQRRPRPAAITAARSDRSGSRGNAMTGGTWRVTLTRPCPARCGGVPNLDARRPGSRTSRTRTRHRPGNPPVSSAAGASPWHASRSHPRRHGSPPTPAAPLAVPGHPATGRSRRQSEFGDRAGRVAGADRPGGGRRRGRRRRPDAADGGIVETLRSALAGWLAYL